MATLHDIPVFRAGTHNGQEFREQDLDEMVASSNACLPYILESIVSGSYPGNNIKTNDKPIPGLINFAHQRYLQDTLKDAVKDITVEFKRKGAWLVATVKNLKADLAEFIRERFPYRSIELIPSLNVGGQTYRNVIRSIGFLPPDIAPAVGGQSPHLAIEYSADGGIIQLYSQLENEVEPMADEKEVKKEATPIVSVDEFAALTARVAEMEAKSKQDDAEKATLAARLQSAITKGEQQDIEMFCRHLETDLRASPAVIQIVKPLLQHADNQQVIEFAADQKVTMRAELQGVIEKFLGMKDSLTVPIGEFAAQNHADPSVKKPSKEEQQAAMIAEFAEQAKAQAKNPNDEREVRGIALQLAVDKYGDALGV